MEDFIIGIFTGIALTASVLGLLVTAFEYSEKKNKKKKKEKNVIQYNE